MLRRSMMLMFLAVTALSGCEIAESSVALAVCNPVLDDLEPGVGPVEGGTVVTVNGLFVATELGVRDVTVHVGGAEAEVTGVFRGGGCGNCDGCIADALRCAECERVCRGEVSWTDDETEEHFAPEVCEEWVSFVAPAAEQAGTADVLLGNAHGSAQTLTFEYVAE